MDMPNPTSERSKLHPLLILAAIAVILFSLIGTAAIMGWLPSSRGARNDLGDAQRAALSANTLQPGQPGYADPAAPPAVAAPSYGTQPQGLAATQVPAPAGTYGDSGMQGATGSGGPDTRAPVVTEDRTYVPPAKSTHKTTRVADTDTGSHWCSTCGNVESVRAITTRARGSGVGAAGGAVLGGLLGNQVGGGMGRSLATVAGAVGGAVVGNQVEGNMKASTSYEIRVRLDDGTLRTFHQHSAPQWHTGDRVRIIKGSLRSA